MVPTMLGFFFDALDAHVIVEYSIDWLFDGLHTVVLFFLFFIITLSSDSVLVGAGCFRVDFVDVGLG